MRNAIIYVFTLLITLAVASPDAFSPFFTPLLQEFFGQTNDTNETPDLLRRQSNVCPSGYSNCAGLGAPGLCCSVNSNCSPDTAGHVACCPRGAVCTGTIGAINTGGATATPSTTTATAATTTNNGLVFASTATTSTTIPGLITSTTGGGQFIIATAASSSGSYTRSTVPNSYYPFTYVPLTYSDTAACSSAYSSCQTAVASCATALGGGSYGITVAAPNGGVTVSEVTTKLPASEASAVCASLSSEACGGLRVESCTASVSGSNGATLAAGTATASASSGAYGSPGLSIYCAAAGAALGMAGELLT